MGEFNEQYVICEYNRGSSKRHFICDKVDHPDDREEPDDGFIVFDLGDVIAKQKYWNYHLPRVKPFYAVKCRPYSAILKVMAAMGLGFDCASKVEMDSILKLGVNPSRIVFSHTRKQPSSLVFALNNGIDLMTFDDEHELLKIKRIFPTARLLLRFAIYDPAADFPPGMKFGCQREHTLKLLQFAKVSKLNVVGVHFHIGTGSKAPSNFLEGIAYSREIFDMAKDVGFILKILDIGGGFPGQALSEGAFKEYAETVNIGLDRYFPQDCGVEIMSEPGSYYMRSAGTVVTSIVGKRKRNSYMKDNSSTTSAFTVHCDYFLNDGLYGSLRDVIYTPQEYLPVPLKKITTCPRYEGVIYGNSCCGTDIIVESCYLPELVEGDWIFFEDKGDYSHMITNFNGFKRPFCYYALPTNCKNLREVLEDKKHGVKNTAASFMVPDDIYQLQRVN